MQTQAHSLCGRNEMNSTDQSPARPTAKEQTSEHLLRSRWKIPFAGFLLGLMGGLSYTWGVYIGPLVERFGWTTAMSALPYSVFMVVFALSMVCLLYTSDAADDLLCVDLGGRRIIKKKKKKNQTKKNKSYT